MAEQIYVYFETNVYVFIVVDACNLDKTYIWLNYGCCFHNYKCSLDTNLSGYNLDSFFGLIYRLLRGYFN
jgi:hypothetical protein